MSVPTPPSRRTPRQRSRLPARPLDEASLRELALSYVARYATSAARLERYLASKLRQRGWQGEAEPPVPALLGEFAALGYIDDAVFARMRAEGLLRRGYGPRRVVEALASAGVADEIARASAPGTPAARAAALRLAERRGFGPFGRQPPDRAQRERQLAAMLRAGHSACDARGILDAATIAEAEAFVAEAGEPEPGREHGE